MFRTMGTTEEAQKRREGVNLISIGPRWVGP